MLIISGVTQGLKNKDIAVQVGTTEQVVKNYLRKIYDKLGVADRLELALYSMHRKLLDSYTPQPIERKATPSLAMAADALADDEREAPDVEAAKPEHFGKT
jgi:hypothetical protein